MKGSVLQDQFYRPCNYNSVTRHKLYFIMILSLICARSGRKGRFALMHRVPLLLHPWAFVPTELGQHEVFPQFFALKVTFSARLLNSI
jgi:hypothetical protein